VKRTEAPEVLNLVWLSIFTSMFLSTESIKAVRHGERLAGFQLSVAAVLTAFAAFLLALTLVVLDHVN
jgi:formate/nitrite transporter FocA (FNT family)